MELSALEQLEPDTLRSILPGWLSAFVDEPDRAERNRGNVTQLVASWSDETCHSIVAHLTEIGARHEVYPAHPDCRRLTRIWCEDVVLQPTIEGIGHLREAMEAGPTMVLGNHLSYFDANATDSALAQAGHAILADRLVAAAGPKVYEDLFRLVAAACIHTLPVPQSTTLGHTAKLSPRELARKALESVNAARQATLEGYVPLVYPEGSRTRSGRLGPFLRGIHRWLAGIEGLQVVPLALSGTDRIMPIGATRLQPGAITLRFAPPLAVGPDGSSREILQRSHEAIRDLLPEHLRPPAGEPDPS